MIEIFFSFNLYHPGAPTRPCCHFQYAPAASSNTPLAPLPIYLCCPFPYAPAASSNTPLPIHLCRPFQYAPGAPSHMPLPPLPIRPCYPFQYAFAGKKARKTWKRGTRLSMTSNVDNVVTIVIIVIILIVIGSVVFNLCTKNQGHLTAKWKDPESLRLVYHNHRALSLDLLNGFSSYKLILGQRRMGDCF